MGCILSKENDKNSTGLDFSKTEAETAEAFAAAELITGGGVTSRIELSISAQGLKDKDIMSKSDPFCVVSLKNAKGAWEEVGRTEIIANNLNPNWVTRIFIYYHFEQMQHVKFSVYDCDVKFKTNETSQLDLKKQDFLGECETVLAPIVKNNGYWQAKLIRKSGNARGNITVRTEEVVNSNGIVHMKLRCTGLQSQSSFSSNNSFIRLSKLREDGSYAPVYKSEVKQGNANPAYAEIVGTTVQLANGDLFRPLKIECFEWLNNGSHKLIGETQASLTQLQQHFDSKSSFPLLNPSMKSKANYTNSGLLNCDSFNNTPQPSFVEYIKGGLEISFIVAIDFTASNLEPNLPNSLHYMHPNGAEYNQYASAITAIGNIIEYYDHDKKFAVYGFGGKPRPGQPADHCFPLNGNESQPEVHGIPDLLNVYYDSLKRVQLSGPTLFGSIIGQASAIAASTPQSQSSQKYYVLLILTDGVINDMDATIDAIVHSSGLPLSINIIGVGDADFSDMERLDGDKVSLKSNTGMRQNRDIVQFTPMAEFKKFQGEAHRAAVARHVLQELPRQVTQFYQSKGIQPKHHVAPPPPPPYEE